MKKIAAIVWFSLLILGSSAQVITYQDFDFPAHPKMNNDTLGSSDAKTVVVHEKRAVDYVFNKQGDLEKYYFLYRKVFIKTETGVEENNKIYTPGGDISDVIMFKARTLSAAGAVVTEQFRSDLKAEDDKESGKFFKCAIEGLKPGMFVEYFYVSRVYSNIRGTEYLQTKQQKLKVEYEIISPAELIFEAKIYNAEGLSFKKITDDTTKNVIRCNFGSIAVKPTEEYTSDDANLVRVEYKLAYNHYQSKARYQTWESAGIVYYNAYHKEIPESKALKKLIKENKLTGKSALEKIYFIEQFIKTGISFNDQSPYETPDDVLKYKVASELAVIRMMVAYFRELEINYELCLGSSRLENPLDKSFDSWNYLQSVMFYFPDENKYLVPKSYELRLGQIPYEMAEVDVLNIREMKLGNTAKGLSSIKHLGTPELKNNIDTLRANLEFNKDMSVIKIQVSRRITGYMANQIRPYYYYSPQDKRDELIRNYLKQDDEHITIQSVDVKNFDLAEYMEETPFAVDAELTHKALVERAGDKLILKVGEVIGRQAELYQEKKRTADIDVRYPHNYYRVIKIRVPDGYKVASLKPAEINFLFKDEKGKNQMAFVSRAEQSGNIITIYVDEYYAFTLLPKSKFEDFKKVINAAADFNKVTLIFERIQ